MQYRQFHVDTTAGLASLDSVNKFLSANKAWSLWQVVMRNEQFALYIVEGPNEAKPDDSTPAGGLKEGATLSERTNVVQMKRAA